MVQVGKFDIKTSTCGMSRLLSCSFDRKTRKDPRFQSSSHSLNRPFEGVSPPKLLSHTALYAPNTTMLDAGIIPAMLLNESNSGIPQHASVFHTVATYVLTDLS